MNGAIHLLDRARDNGGGLELHDVFGPTAEDLVTVEQIVSAIQGHLALQWGLQAPALLELQRDNTLTPPVWFVLTAAGETFATLPGLPAELMGSSDPKRSCCASGGGRTRFATYRR
jgi:hypothetical protein